MLMNFEEVTGWGGETWDRDVTGVAVDSHDRVYVLRHGDVPVTVFQSDGTVLDRWGQGCFSRRPHFISIGNDNRIYIEIGRAHV